MGQKELLLRLRPPVVLPPQTDVAERPMFEEYGSDYEAAGPSWRQRLEELLRLLEVDIQEADLTQATEHVTAADSLAPVDSYRRKQWTRSARIVQAAMVAVRGRICLDAQEEMCQFVAGRLHAGTNML